MTKNRAQAALTYKFQKNENIFLDANIWLSLFPAPSDSNRSSARTYSAVLKSMIGAGVNIIVSSLVLSEYLNRYCRIEFEALHKAKYSSFKKFRQSADYLSVGAAAASFAQQIMKICSKCDDGFSTADISELLIGFSSGDLDFNDGMIVNCCQANGFKLLTHDGDFVNGGIDVLTENQKLLRACP